MAGSATIGASRARAGGRILPLLSDALNVSILRALLRGPLPVSELARCLGPTSRTTRFSRLRDLEQLGVIVRERRPGTPPVAYCALSTAGMRLLPVLRRFARWLAMDPSGPSSPDDLSGARAIKALAIAWDTWVLRWLAERPYSVTELDSLAPPAVTYHEIRKAREALSGAGLIAPVASDERGQPYAPVDWARRAAGCIAAAIEWERDFVEAAAPPSPVDLQTLLLMLLPLIDDLWVRGGGACALGIDGLDDMSVTVKDGRVAASPNGLTRHRSNRVSGSAESWFEAIVEGRADSLRMRGGIHLTTAMADGLHRACARCATKRSAAALDRSSTQWCADSARKNRTPSISSAFTDDEVNHL